MASPFIMASRDQVWVSAGVYCFLGAAAAGYAAGCFFVVDNYHDLVMVVVAPIDVGLIQEFAPMIHQTS